MPCPIPPEMLDHIVDHLHDEPTALETCCVVSKAWIHRTRKHLFYSIMFHPSIRSISRWRAAFPDPTNSPAHYTRNLTVHDPHLLAPENADTLLAFCGVVFLNMGAGPHRSRIVSLAPLRGVFPVLRSLHVTFIFPQDADIPDLICSFPLLEDLSLVSPMRQDNNGQWNTPSTSPRLTGSLQLHLFEGIPSTASWLLGLPNGLHFTKIAVTWFFDGDVPATMELVSRCAGTLESLDIASHFWDMSVTLPLNLFKARKLQDLVFRCKNSHVQWITAALQTIDPKHIQQVSLELSPYILEGEDDEKWSNLDSALVDFRTSHAPRLKVMYDTRRGWEDQNAHITRLLPEVMKRGAVDLVDLSHVKRAPSGFHM